MAEIGMGIILIALLGRYLIRIHLQESISNLGREEEPNHYYFDLNRDWAWQTQLESKQRLALYNQWMPQVHVDFHEQSYNEPYYFAPAAEPVHQDITPWQKSFQVVVEKQCKVF
ncbi:M14 family metallopeptidase [Pedobacter jamesrossensis]|uniref:hypothetical protein n=1 Tax=Pedobacter jamesrossensis TaxID=1908238 RepID=UPI00361F0B83